MAVAIVHAVLTRARWKRDGEARWKWAWRRSLWSAVGVGALMFELASRVGQSLTYRTPLYTAVFVGVLWSIIGGAREAGGWHLTL